MEIVPLFGETTSDTDSVSTTEQPTSTIPIVPESPFHQKQLHLLTNAFKGSVNHRISSTGRKPSVLKLSKRTDSAESSLLLTASPHVKFAPNEFADGSHENENEAQLRRGRFASMAARRSILKRSEYSEQIVSAKPFAAPPNITPTAAINTDDMTPEQLQASTREQQLEQQRVELLQSIHFHHHRDKSKSHIDVKVLAERQWLDEYPQSQRWKEIENKVSTSQSEQGREMMDQENELAERFIDTAILQGAAHINNLLSGADNDKERLVVRLTFALLNDVISDMIRETCADMLKQSAQAWAVLNKSLVKSLASVSLGLEGSSSRYILVGTTDNTNFSVAVAS